jgi:hypothetical protein
MPIPVAARCKSWVYSCSLVRNAVSNLAGGMDVSVLSVLCFQVEVSATGRSLVQMIPTDCGVSECYLETSNNDI